MTCAQVLMLGAVSQAALAADRVTASSTSSATITPTSSTSAAAYSDDERAIRDQAADYAKIYATRDPRALASLWAPDGTFTDSKGAEHIGRSAIESYFREGFADGNAQTLDVSVESVKFPAPVVAIEEGTTRIASGPGLGSMGRYLVVHTKTGGKMADANSDRNRLQRQIQRRISQRSGLVSRLLVTQRSTARSASQSQLVKK